MSDESRREYAKMILARGGGMITTGGNLGVFVSKATNLPGCPNGWIFVDIETTTLDQLCEAIEQASTVRKHWPKNAKNDGQKDEEES